MVDPWDGTDVADCIHATLGSVGLPDSVDLVRVQDSLARGPCHSNPEQHRELRRDYWLAGEEIYLPRRRLRKKSRPDNWNLFVCWNPKQGQTVAPSFAEALSRFSSKRPVILWTTGNWVERLTLWWLLSAIERGDADRSRCFIAHASSPDASADLRRPNPDTLACVPPRFLRTAFDRRKRLSRSMVVEGARLWRKYCRSSPAAFDEARRRGSETFPDLSAIAEWHGVWFPRRDARSSRIRLSQFDETVLEGFSSDEWRTPLDVYCASFHAAQLLNGSESDMASTVDGLADSFARYRRHGHDDRRLRAMVEERVTRRQRDRLQPVTGEFGTELFVRRLLEWERHNQEDPALISSAGPNQVNQMSCICYRLTKKGRRLLEEGMSSFADLPPLPVGGCTVNSSTAFWIRQMDGRQWSLEMA
jgi:hypothetical protein